MDWFSWSECPYTLGIRKGFLMHTQTRTGQTLVIGCGNLLCGDDAVGPTLIQRFRDRGVPVGIDCFDAATDAISVIDAMRGRESVVFVDACLSGAAPGTIIALSGIDTEEVPATRIPVHGLRWSHAIVAARQMLGAEYPRSVTAWLIEGLDFEPGAPLTPAVDKAIDQLIGRLVD